MRDRKLSYEDYFDVDESFTASERTEKRDVRKLGQKSLTFEQFLEQHDESTGIFDSEMQELEYKFWETDEEKQYRIAKLWTDLKKNQATMSPDNQRKATEDQTKLTKEICELTRRIRWRVDQEYVRKNREPLFKDNYHSYTKNEFMLDADFEFYKVRNLLTKSPRLL